MFGLAVIVRVLDDAFANFERQVQAGKFGIAQLHIFHGAQRLQVVVEELAVAPHQEVERALAGMSEGRMADVVNQRQRLDQIDIQIERARRWCARSARPPWCGSGECGSGRSSGG